MKIGEFFVNITTKGDTKKLDETAKKLAEAEKRTRSLLSYLNKLSKATTEQEKKLIKENYAQQVKLDKLNKVRNEQNAVTASMKSGIATATKWVAAISASVVALDRLGNSLLKSNQMYMTFEKQTGMGINRLNRMAGVAQLSGMNLSPEQVAGDLTSLQQKIYRLGLTGEGSGIFAQLGMNPMGMNSDQFISALRQRTKGMSAGSKSYILSELGLSQEWLNVLELTNQEFSDYVKQSQALQLSEQERKQLAKYTVQQQKNNMRWELARQKLLLNMMPTIQKIMDMASKIALKFSESIGNQRFVNVLRDMALLLTTMAIRAGAIQKAFGFLTAMKGLANLGTLFTGGALALTADKTMGKKALVGAGALTTNKMIGKKALVGAGASVLGPIGVLLQIGLGIWTIVDLFDLFLHKDKKLDEEPIEPVDSTNQYQYKNMNSNMTNNFYNNPQPSQAIINELTVMSDRYLSSAYK